MCSFRTCLRRYSFFDFNSYTQNVAAVSAAITSKTVVVDPAQHPPGSMMHYVSQSYSGWRGGIRVRTYPALRASASQIPVSFITTLSRDRGPTRINNILNLSRTTWGMDRFWDGMQISTENMSYTTSVELPYYSNERFSLCGYKDNWKLACNLATRVQGWMDEDTRVGIADVFTTAIGDDFQLFFFLGVQPLWRAS